MANGYAQNLLANSSTPSFADIKPFQSESAFGKSLQTGFNPSADNALGFSGNTGFQPTELPSVDMNFGMPEGQFGVPETQSSFDSLGKVDELNLSTNTNITNPKTDGFFGDMTGMDIANAGINTIGAVGELWAGIGQVNAMKDKVQISRDALNFDIAKDTRIQDAYKTARA